jgi:hypothetical protein
MSIKLQVLCFGNSTCGFILWGVRCVVFTYIYIHSRVIPDIPPRHLRFTKNLLAMRNTADVTGGKPITDLLQSISGVSAIIPLVAFYDVHEGKIRSCVLCGVRDKIKE